VAVTILLSLGCIGDSTRAAQPAFSSQLTEAQSISLTILRLDNGNGEAVVSSGIPLPPGYLGEGDLGLVRLEVGGEERAIYVGALAGRHPDGSLRSVLIQFRETLGRGASRPGVLTVGPGVSRSQPDLDPTAVTWAEPPAVALPNSPDYLAESLIVGPSVTNEWLQRGAYQAWQAEFERYGEVRWENDDMSIVDIHQYDRSLVWYAGWVRSADPKYWLRGTRAAAAYRERSDPHYQWQPHFQESQGLEIHYLLTGDQRARDAVREIALFMDLAYRDYIDRDPFREWMDSRIQTRVFLSALIAWRLNVGGKDWDALIRQDLDQILSTQAEDGAMRWFSWDEEHSVFMASLLMHAMIKYYTWVEADERIPPFIKRILDFVHPSLWTGDSWQYTSVDEDPTVDLNQLNAVPYAWYGWHSGDQAYTTIAKMAFEAAATDAYLASWKQFNQNYRGAHETLYYVLQRFPSRPPLQPEMMRLPIPPRSQTRP
jgi:hypothetical protein